MWWLLAILSGVFMCGLMRPRYTVNNYVENYTDVDVDCGCGGGGDSYCSDNDGGSDDQNG